jgi:predicted flavoprotein YhiN
VGGAILVVDSILNCLTTDCNKKNIRIRKENPVSKLRMQVSIKKINTEISAKFEAMFEEIMY